MRALVLLIALAASPAAPPAAPPPRVLGVTRPAGGEWLGLYLLGRKAGYSYAALGEDPLDGRRAIRSDATLRFTALVGGSPVTRTLEERRWYEPRDGGRLLGFRGHQSGDGGDITTTGRCDETRCKVTVEQGGRSLEKVIPSPGETLEYADPVRLVAASGNPLETPFLDLTRLEPHTLVTRVIGKGTQVLEGVRVPVVRVGSRDRSETLETVTTLSVADGRVLEQTSGESLRAVAESERSATAAAPEAVDLFSLIRVRLPASVQPGTRELSLVIAGLPAEFRHDDERQHFEDLGAGKVRVTLRARSPVAIASAAADPKRFAAELAATTTIDHDAPEVAELARRLLATESTGSWRRASVLLAWVHENVRSVYGQSLDRASLVAVQRKGDCTEHALLYVALARASGIPARLVHGLVATGDDEGRAFDWHAWAEIWVGEWIAVDPTFGQMVADATHLELGQGDDASVVGLMGQLRVLQVGAPGAALR